MRVMLVFDEGRLAGVVPLVVACERTRLGTLRSLRYPLHGWGSFYGPIGADSRLLLRHTLSRSPGHAARLGPARFVVGRPRRRRWRRNG